MEHYPQRNSLTWTEGFKEPLLIRLNLIKLMPFGNLPESYRWQKAYRPRIDGLAFSEAFILVLSPNRFPYLEPSGDMQRQLPCWPFLSACIFIQIRQKSSGSKRNMRNQRLFDFRINRQ